MLFLRKFQILQLIVSSEHSVFNGTQVLKILPIPSSSFQHVSAMLTLGKILPKEHLYIGGSSRYQLPDPEDSVFKVSISQEDKDALVTKTIQNRSKILDNEA